MDDYYTSVRNAIKQTHKLDPQYALTNPLVASIKDTFDAEYSGIISNGATITWDILLANMYSAIKDSMSITVNGGQVIFSQDCAEVNANNEIGINVDQLTKLIDAIKNVAKSQAFSDDEKEELNENLETIDEEAKSSKPKKGLLKTAIKGLKGIKGTAEFAAAVATLVEFVQNVILKIPS